MNWLRQNLLFAGFVLLCAVAVAWETRELVRAAQRTSRSAAALRQRSDERRGLAQRTPALSAENVAAIAEDVARAEQRRDELRRSLLVGPELPPAPERPLDVYFELAAFAGRMRTLARRQQVELRADERFGFATHVSAGPAPASLAAVHRQRVLVERFLETLLEARPRALLAVQRERPDGNEPDRGEVAEDFFAPAAPLLVRVAGAVNTDAFRLEFTGQTAALRSFLNGLSALGLPLIVRSVEVEPLAAGDGRPTGESTAPADSVPVVARNFSRFVVVVECLQLPAEPAGSRSP